MATVFHMLRTLALALWVGSISFFAFGVAPVAFHVLPSSHEAGLVVGGSLRVLHSLGFACGAVYLLTALLEIAASYRVRTRLLPTALVLAMTGLTAYSAFVVLPRMEQDRTAAGGAIDSVSAAAPARADFDHLHHVSEQVEGAILICGLLAILITSVQPWMQHRLEATP